MNRYLTRQELYQLVWSEPISVVAKRMEMSDVGLAKACRRARVPIPERGYWAKRKAGKPVIQPTLPPRGLGMSDGTDVLVSSSNDPVVADGGFMLAPPKFSEDIPQVTARVREMVGKVSVPKNLAKPHPLIARLLEEDERRRETQRTTPYPYSWNNPLFDSPIERRRLRILNAMFLALARCDAKPSIKGRELKELEVQVGQQNISYILERLTSRARTARRSGANNEKSPPERLRLRLITSSRDNDRSQSWEDREGMTLEDQVADIVTNLIVAGEVQYRNLRQQHYDWLVEQRRREEEEARRKQEEAARQERERLIKEQQDRIDRLLGEAMALRQATDIRAYVDAVMARVQREDDDPVKLERLRAWASWALAEADRIDPIKSERFLLGIAPLANDAK